MSPGKSSFSFKARNNPSLKGDSELWSHLLKARQVFNTPVKDLAYKDLLTSTFTQASHDRGKREYLRPAAARKKKVLQIGHQYHKSLQDHINFQEKQTHVGKIPITRGLQSRSIALCPVLASYSACTFLCCINLWCTTNTLSHVYLLQQLSNCFHCCPPRSLAFSVWSCCIRRFRWCQVSTFCCLIHHFVIRAHRRRAAGTSHQSKPLILSMQALISLSYWAVARQCHLPRHARTSRATTTVVRRY